VWRYVGRFLVVSLWAKHLIGLPPPLSGYNVSELIMWQLDSKNATVTSLSSGREQNWKLYNKLLSTHQIIQKILYFSLRLTTQHSYFIHKRRHCLS